MSEPTENIDDYRVFVDTENRLARILFSVGGANVTISLNAGDAQKLIAALGRAVEKLERLPRNH